MRDFTLYPGPVSEAVTDQVVAVVTEQGATGSSKDNFHDADVAARIQCANRTEGSSAVQ